MHEQFIIVPTVLTYSCPTPPHPGISHSSRLTIPAVSHQAEFRGPSPPVKPGKMHCRYALCTIRSSLFAQTTEHNITWNAEIPIERWTWKNCSCKCAADCEHCVTQSSTEQLEPSDNHHNSDVVKRRGGRLSCKSYTRYHQTIIPNISIKNMNFGHRSNNHVLLDVHWLGERPRRTTV